MFNTDIPQGKKTGLILRDYQSFPVGCHAFAPPLPDSFLIPENEWPERLAYNRAHKCGLLDLRQANYGYLKSLDQNGYGLCWAFSSTKACMYRRKLMNEPDVVLSAWYVAGMINGWRDQGGWGLRSLEFIAKNGIPAMSKCPRYSHSAVAADASQNALLHQCQLWWDGSEDPYQAQKQAVSLLLQGIPCIIDLNDMSHSMCAIDIGSLDPLEIIYDNSWGEQGEQGLYRGRGARARPDGLVVPQMVKASTV